MRQEKRLAWWDSRLASKLGITARRRAYVPPDTGWKQRDYEELARYRRIRVADEAFNAEVENLSPDEWYDLRQRAVDAVTTTVQKVTSIVPSTMTVAAHASPKTTSYKLATPARDGNLPFFDTLWEKIKEWWRVRTLKIDHPDYPPPDAGSGQHGVREPTWADFAFEEVLPAGTVKFLLQGYDDAARHMSHYLGNSGRELKVSVDEMMTEMPQFELAV